MAGSFNSAGAGGLNAVYFAGSTQGAPNDGLLLAAHVTSRIGIRRERVLTQPLPRLSGANSQHFGVGPVPIEFAVDVHVASLANFDSWLAKIDAYRIGGRYALVDEFGRSRTYCEQRGYTADPPQIIAGTSQYVVAMVIDFVDMQPR